MVKIITDSVASIPADAAREAGIDVVTLYVNRDGPRATPTRRWTSTRSTPTSTRWPTTSPPPASLRRHALEAAFEARRAGRRRGAGRVHLLRALGRLRGGRARRARREAARNIGFSYALVDSSLVRLRRGVAGVRRRGRPRRPAGDLAALRAPPSLAGRRVARASCSRPRTLTFLQKGGRIGNAAALLGNLVRLAPVLTVIDGKATTFAKVRTRKKALERIAEAFLADVEEHGLRRAAVHYIGDRAPAVAWARDVVEPLIGRAVSVLPVSPVIGLHVGPAVGIAYECASALKGKLTGPVRVQAAS